MAVVTTAMVGAILELPNMGTIALFVMARVPTERKRINNGLGIEKSHESTEKDQESR